MGVRTEYKSNENTASSRPMKELKIPLETFEKQLFPEQTLP